MNYKLLNTTPNHSLRETFDKNAFGVENCVHEECFNGTETGVLIESTRLLLCRPDIERRKVHVCYDTNISM